MEIATLFVIGTMKGVRTAAIAVADGHIFAENEYDPHGTVVANGARTSFVRQGTDGRLARLCCPIAATCRARCPPARVRAACGGVRSVSVPGGRRRRG